MHRSATNRAKIVAPDNHGGGKRCQGVVREVARLDRTRFIETTEDGDLFAFRCPGCGSEGELLVPSAVGARQFKMECCGANYVRSLGELLGEAPRLVAVIVPVFRKVLA